MGLNELSTAPIADEVDFTNLPEQMGSYPDPPQPGPYRFRLSPLKSDNFGAVDGKEYGPRVKVMFNADAPLIIIQAADQMAVNDTFQTTITNVPRRRGKGDDAKKASDWDYLNQALGETSRPTSPRAYADAIIAQSNGGAEFGADVEWSWRCNPDRDALYPVEGGSPAAITAADGSAQKGCGARHYQGKDWKVAVPAENKSGNVPKGGDGKYPRDISCTACGANVRGFANLTRFRK